MRFSPGCECCATDPPPEECGDCYPTFNDQPDHWVVTQTIELSGNYSGSCPCEDIPIPQTLDHFGESFPCTWGAQGDSVICPSGSGQTMLITLTYVPAFLEWQLVYSINFLNISAVYICASEDWVCEGPNTMTLDSTGATCTGWPGSLEITAVYD